MSDSTKSVSDWAVIQSLIQEHNEGYFGHVFRQAFTTPIRPLPVSGQFDKEEGTLSFTWNEAPQGDVKAVLNYSYQRNVLPIKGTFISLDELVDWKDLEAGEHPTRAYLSAEFENRIREILIARRNDQDASSVGENAEDRQLSKFADKLLDSQLGFLQVLGRTQSVSHSWS